MNECSHAKSEPRKRTKGNGTVVVTTQCLDCGRSLGEKPKAQFNVQQLEDYDEALKDQVGDSKAPEREAARLKTAQDWWDSYNDYLHSDHWRRVREIVLARDYLCQVCFKVRAVQAHHLSYESFKRWGMSFAIECVGICVACHERLHGTR